MLVDTVNNNGPALHNIMVVCVNEMRVRNTKKTKGKIITMMMVMATAMMHNNFLLLYNMTMAYGKRGGGINVNGMTGF